MTTPDRTLSPGFCPDNALHDETPGMISAFMDFMRSDQRNWAGTIIGDIGAAGYKSREMAKHLCYVEQVNATDFNWDALSESVIATVNGVQIRAKQRYSVITCFEVLEHLQNPLWFIRQLRLMLKPGGVIYLSAPGRQIPFWGEYHFLEYTPEHLQKWLLNPEGLEIVRFKKVRIPHPLRFYFSGIRPFLRLFVGYTNLYEIRVRQ